MFDALVIALELFMGVGVAWLAWLAVEGYIERRNELKALNGSKEGEQK